MKHLIFNELTETPLVANLTEAITRIEQLLETHENRPVTVFDKGIWQDKHIGEIRLTNEIKVQNLASSHGRVRTLFSALLQLGRRPYIEEGSIEEEHYVMNHYSISKGDERLSVIGLAAVHLQKSVAIGFESEPFWKEHVFPLTIENSDGVFTTACVFSVSSPDHFSSQEIVRWIEEYTPVNLQETSLHPDEKTIHLRDDHGKDRLLLFAKRIIRSPYITQIINSCEFSPQNHRFIRNISDDGIIEITIPGADQGFGMAIQTTGRNKRETEKIAELLTTDYA